MQNPPKTHKNGRHNSRKKHLRWLILAIGLGISAAIGTAGAVIGAYYYVAPALPAAETIRDIPLQIPLRIFSRDGHLISEIGERRRVLVTYDEVPAHVVNAFVAADRIERRQNHATRPWTLEYPSSPGRSSALVDRQPGNL